MIYFSSLCADGGKAVVSSVFALSLVQLSESVETASAPPVGADGSFGVREPKISRAVIAAQRKKKIREITRQPVPFELFSALRPRRRSPD